jgi:hypothetical protein
MSVHNDHIGYLYDGYQVGLFLQGSSVQVVKPCTHLYLTAKVKTGGADPLLALEALFVFQAVKHLGLGRPFKWLEDGMS